MGRDPKPRAADADRESTAERIRLSHAEGRLDTDELQQRLERCYEAKTLGELEELVIDLPRQSVEDPTPRSWRHAPLRWRLGPFIPALVALIVISAVSGRHAFWLLVPLVFLAPRICWWRCRPSRMIGEARPGTWL